MIQMCGLVGFDINIFLFCNSETSRLETGDMEQYEHTFGSSRKDI